MLNALDDEGAAPAEVSGERDGLANAGQNRNVHKGVDLVMLIFCLVEKDDLNVERRASGGAVRRLLRALNISLPRSMGYRAVERARNDSGGHVC